MDPRTLGKYELRSVLGRGATGTVYEGWDPVIARKVAIKTVNLPPAGEAQDDLARFRREAQAAGRLSHPGIVAAYDYGEIETLAYIVMEFVDGRTLKSLLEGDERLPLPAALRVMNDVLEALEYSHGRGVVHRDIKPANVILTAEGRAKVADFGIARIESSNLTQAGTVMGTPAYMSPEQFMGQVVDRRTDIYACGVLLYQLLTGERPFEGSLTAVMHKALNTTPLPPSELAVTAPPVLDAVVARAMAKRPDDRYGSASQFARAIQDAVAAPAAPPPLVEDATIVSPPPAQPVPTRGRSRPLALGVAGLAATLGIAAWLLLAPARTGDGPALAPVPPPGDAPAQPQDGAKLLPGVPDPSLAPNAPEPRQGTPQDLAFQSPRVPLLPPEAVMPQAPAQPRSPAATSSSTPESAPTAAPEPRTTPVRPPPPPEPPSPPPPDPQDALRAAVAATLDTIPCALLGGDVSGPNELRLTGLARKGIETDIRVAVTRAAPGHRIVWAVTPFEGSTFCPTLDVLRPVAGRFGAPNGLAVSTADGRTFYRDRELVIMPAEMPPFAASLRVDLMSSNGLVGNVRPGAGTPEAQRSPNDRVDVEIEIGPPYGTDLVIVLASETPLFSAPRPHEEPSPTYLRDLRAALDTARRDGSRVAAAALILVTSPASPPPRR